MYIFGRSHIENAIRWQKMTDTIVFLGEPTVRLCEKVRSKWSGNWCKIPSNFLHRPIVYRPYIGVDVYLRAVSVTEWTDRYPR
jgi:hypothetical protein